MWCRTLPVGALAFAVAVVACSTPRRPPARRDPVPALAPVPAPDATRTPIDLVAWNVNSGVAAGGHDAQLPYLREVFRGGAEVELFALSEVEPSWFPILEGAADASGRPYGLVTTGAGRNQRIALLLAEDRFDVLGRDELTGVQFSDAHRNPLSVTLLDRTNQVRFEVITVHLARANAEARAVEAERLGRLIRRGSDPLLVVGDFNLDCPQGDAPAGCDPAPLASLRGAGGLVWIAPVQERSTTCHPRYDDMLDLVFAGRGAQEWGLRVEIDADDSVCARMASGAHRPIRVEVIPGG